MDDLMSRGRESAEQAMNDPEMRDRVTGQAQDHFGNVPGVSQAARASGTRGGAPSEQETGGEPAAEDDTGAYASAPDDKATGEAESSQD